MATAPSPLTQLQVPQKSSIAKLRPRTAPAPGVQPLTQQQNIASVISGLGPGQPDTGGQGVPITGDPFPNPLKDNFRSAFPNLDPSQIDALAARVGQGFSTQQAADQLGIAISLPQQAPVPTPNSNPATGVVARDRNNPNAPSLTGFVPPPVTQALPPTAGTQQTPAGPFEQFSNPNFPQGPGLSGGIGEDFGFDRDEIFNSLSATPGVISNLQNSPLPGITNQNLFNLGQGLNNDLLPRASTSLADRLGRGPEAGFQDLPFSDQLSSIISQFGGQLGGPIQGQGELQQLLSQLSGGNLPKSFQGELEGLVGSLGDSGTNPFGPGLTGEEAEAQRGILDTTLERARGRAVTDIKADAARRGLTSADAPSQERLARLDEELARQSGTLANQQLLQDFDLRRSSGQLGLSRQQTLADLIQGTRAEDLGQADLLARLGLGTGGQDKQFQLEAGGLAGDQIGQERGLQAQQQRDLIDQITRLMLGQQGLGLGQQQTLADTDLKQQAIDRLNQGDFGGFLSLLFSGNGSSGGGGNSGGVVGGIADIIRGNPTGPLTTHPNEGEGTNPTGGGNQPVPTVGDVLGTPPLPEKPNDGGGFKLPPELIPAVIDIIVGGGSGDSNPLDPLDGRDFNPVFNNPFDVSNSIFDVVDDLDRFPTRFPGGPRIR